MERIGFVVGIIPFGALARVHLQSWHRAVLVDALRKVWPELVEFVTRAPEV